MYGKVVHYPLFSFVHLSVVSGNTHGTLCLPCMGNLHAATCVTAYKYYNASHAAYLHTC